MSERLEITREEAERLLQAIAWTEGEGQAMLTGAEGAALDEAGLKSDSGRALLDTANAAHDALREKLRAFVERRSPAEPGSTGAGITAEADRAAEEALARLDRISARLRSVPCRACRAEVGAGCRTPSGEPTAEHQARQDDLERRSGDPEVEERDFTCAYCAGEGRIPQGESSRLTCSRCHGTGFVLEGRAEP